MVVRRAQQVASAAAVPVLFVIVVGVKVICGGGAAEQVAIGLEPNGLVTVTAIVNRMHPTTMLLSVIG